MFYFTLCILVFIPVLLLFKFLVKFLMFSSACFHVFLEFPGLFWRFSTSLCLVLCLPWRFSPASPCMPHPGVSNYPLPPCKYTVSPCAPFVLCQIIEHVWLPFCPLSCGFLVSWLFSWILNFCLCPWEFVCCSGLTAGFWSMPPIWLWVCQSLVMTMVYLPVASGTQSLRAHSHGAQLFRTVPEHDFLFMVLMYTFQPCQGQRSAHASQTIRTLCITQHVV